MAMIIVSYLYDKLMFEIIKLDDFKKTQISLKKERGYLEQSNLSFDELIYKYITFQQQP